MRTGEDQYIAKGHEFYDSMVTAVLGMQTVVVYEFIRRFVWRSDEKGSRTVRAERRAGRLSAQVSQAKLAQMTGLSRGTINLVIERLRRVGWLYTVETKNADGGAGPLTYILGETSSTGSEVFFADGFLRQLHDYLEESGESLPLLTLSEREELTRAFVAEIELRYDKQLERGSAPAPQTLLYPPVILADTPGQLPRHPLSSSLTPPVHQLNTEEDNPQEENQEEENPEGEEPSPEARSLRATIRKDLKPIRGEARAEEEGEPSGPKPKGETRMPGDAKESRTPQTRAAEMVRDHMVAGKGGAEAIAMLKQQAVERRSKQIDKLKRSERATKNLSGESAKPLTHTRGVAALQEVWMAEMAEHHPATPVAPWDGQRRGQAAKLAESYGSEAVDAVRYVVRQWLSVSTRMLGKPGDVPTVGFLLRFADRIVPAAVAYKKHAATIQEHAEWVKAHPWDGAPQELEQRYTAAKAELDRLGVQI